MSTYTVEVHWGDPISAIEGVLFSGPLPRAGDILTVPPGDETKRIRLQVKHVEHECWLQVTGTYACKAIVVVEGVP